MEQQQINKLLQKYLEAETTLEEEARLKEYFTQTKDLPPEWEEYRMLFSFYQKEQEHSFSGDIFLPQKRSYKWTFRMAGMVAVLIVLFLIQPFVGSRSGSENSGNSGVASENVRSLFMLMRSEERRVGKECSAVWARDL